MLRPCNNFLGTSGFTLVELMVALSIVAIASTAALTVYFSHEQAERLSEQRRLANLACEEKLEQIRAEIASGVSLETEWSDYGPLPSDTGGPKSTFTVNGLPSDGNTVLGTVTIINDETPNEAEFGYNFGSTPTRFGVDIDGNRNYSDVNPSPFPLDLNGDGKTDNHAVTGGFTLLPVVVTVRWLGPYGPERLDMFTILTRESVP